MIPIGAAGFSQGGRLVPNIAVRNEKVKFIASVSGPITGVGFTRNFAFRNSVLESQIRDSVQEIILPIWEAQFKALDSRDKNELERIDSLISQKAKELSRGVLPPYSSDIPKTPIFNSMGMDFVSELDQLSVPWLSLYGEWDRVVPVEESITNIKRQMSAAGNKEYEIKVFPKGDHNLRNSETQEWYPMEQILIGWILKQVE
jgi:pimeloyl-ACP methyl ester carboxylesterase